MEKRVTFKGWLLPLALIAPQVIISAVFFFYPAAQAIWQSLFIPDPFGLSALLVLPSLAAAQETPGFWRIHATGEPRYAFHDLDTQTTLLSNDPFPGQTVPGVASLGGSEPCFDNSLDLTTRDALLYPAGDEIYDWGIKDCGGSNYVDQITIGYGSLAAPDNNGVLTLRFYEGGRGFGLFGQQVAELNLTGLPSSGDTFPGVHPIYLTIDLGAQAFALPDGPIAWSFENPDGLSAPLLVPISLANGTQNYFDVYSPGPASAGNYAGTFRLPAGPNSFDPLENSFYIIIEENDVVADTTAIPGAGNPNNMLSLGTPVIGEDWGARFNLIAFPDVTQTAVFVSRGQLTNVFTPFGELIADPGQLAAPFSISNGDTHNFPVPLSPTLLGLTFYAQGSFLSTSQGFRLTNGFALHVGSL